MEWASAAIPATAGDAIDVPLSVRLPTAVTDVPLAAISGISRSPWSLAGLRNTVVDDIDEASSLWLPTVRLLYVLWLTNSSVGGLIVAPGSPVLPAA